MGQQQEIFWELFYCTLNLASWVTHTHSKGHSDPFSLQQIIEITAFEFRVLSVSSIIWLMSFSIRPLVLCKFSCYISTKPSKVGLVKKVHKLALIINQWWASSSSRGQWGEMLTLIAICGFSQLQEERRQQDRYMHNVLHRTPFEQRLHLRTSMMDFGQQCEAEKPHRHHRHLLPNPANSIEGSSGPAPGPRKPGKLNQWGGQVADIRCAYSNQVFSGLEVATRSAA